MLEGFYCPILPVLIVFCSVRYCWLAIIYMFSFSIYWNVFYCSRIMLASVAVCIEIDSEGAFRISSTLTSRLSSCYKLNLTVLLSGDYSFIISFVTFINWERWTSSCSSLSPGRFIFFSDDSACIKSVCFYLMKDSLFVGPLDILAFFLLY